MNEPIGPAGVGSYGVVVCCKSCCQWPTNHYVNHFKYRQLSTKGWGPYSLFFLIQLPPQPQRNYMNESLVGSGVESWLSRGILLTTAWQATEQGKPKRSLTSHVHHHLARQLQNTDIKNPHHMMGAHQIGYCLVSTPSLVTSNASLSCYTLFSGSSFF